MVWSTISIGYPHTLQEVMQLQWVKRKQRQNILEWLGDLKERWKEQHL